MVEEGKANTLMELLLPTIHSIAFSLQFSLTEITPAKNLMMQLLEQELGKKISHVSAEAAFKKYFEIDVRENLFQVCKNTIPKKKDNNSIARREGFVLHHDRYHKENSSVGIFTDGSFSRNGFGCAAVMDEVNSYKVRARKLVRVRTPQETELHGILLGLSLAESSSHKYHCIFSDCLNALTLLRNTSFHHPNNLQRFFEGETLSVLLKIADCLPRIAGKGKK